METEIQQANLIRQLLLEAGRIMEDGSPEMALSLPDDITGIRKRVLHLTRDAGCLFALASAAEAVLQRADSRNDAP